MAFNFFPAKEFGKKAQCADTSEAPKGGEAFRCVSPHPHSQPCPLPDPTTYARRTRAPPRESGAGLRDSVDAIVVRHVSEITSK